jgi:hypothetical protein
MKEEVTDITCKYNKKRKGRKQEQNDRFYIRQTYTVCRFTVEDPQKCREKAALAIALQKRKLGNK